MANTEEFEKLKKIVVLMYRMFPWYFKRANVEELHPWDKKSHDDFLSEMENRLSALGIRP